VQYAFNLKSQRQWGYTLRYDSAKFTVLTLHHPPEQGGQGSRGEGLAPHLSHKILLDPGHGGTGWVSYRGPFGYPEKIYQLGGIQTGARTTGLHEELQFYMTRMRRIRSVSARAGGAD